MKRIISVAILTVFLITAAVPAMAGGCDYHDTFGDHDWYQTGFNYPTCTENGYYVLKCHDCGYSKKESNGKAYGHNWEKSGEKSPTCTEKGSASYWCIECGATKTDTTKALGHKYKVLDVKKEATCLEGGQEKVKCSRCGVTSTRDTGKTDHVYGEWVITVEATASSKGVRTSKCIHCGKEKTEEYYPEGTLYRGVSDKENVKTLQTQLTDCGYLNDTIDGIFGKKTEQAVKDFQTAAGFAVDGIAWPQTNKQLEMAWQKLNGIVVEETEEVEEAKPAAANCARIENENGSVEFVYCADHQILEDAVDALFEENMTDEEYINALQLVRQMYQEEVEMRFAEWLESSADEDKASILGAQTMFLGYMNTQEAVWKKQHGENSEVTLTKINDMLHEKWVEICGIISPVSAE